MRPTARLRRWIMGARRVVLDLALRCAVAGWVAQLGVVTPALAVDSQESADFPAFDLSRMTFVASRGPLSEIVVEAERAQLGAEVEVVTLERVRARVLGEDGQLRLAVVCDRGEFDLATNDFTASGRVKGRTGDGRRFTSAWLRYEHAAGLAATDAPVVIHEGDRTLRGGGLRYHVREGRLRLLGGATVVEGP